MWISGPTSASPVTPPPELILRAVRAKLREFEDPKSVLWSALRLVTHAKVATHGFTFNFDLSKLGEEGGATLAEAFTHIVNEAETDLVFIVDEVQECLGREDAQALMQALKAARDAINLRPGTPGYFLFIGTGSHRSLVQEMTVRRKEAFAGAVNLDYPVLDEGFVSWVLGQLQTQRVTAQPSHAAAWQAFQDLGHRPEPFLDALRILAHTVKPGEDTEAMLRAIVWTKRNSLADRELSALEDLGPLAQLIFNRIATHEGEEARGLYSTEALEAHTVALGAEVRTEEVQAMVIALQQKNLIRRMGRGSNLRNHDQNLPLRLGLLRSASVRHRPEALRLLGLKRVRDLCARELAARVRDPARAHEDWSISTAVRCSCPLCAKLTQFLRSNQQRLEWPLATADRLHVHRRIDGHDLPVVHTTRRAGRPFTLVLEKTPALFEREAATRTVAAQDLRWIEGVSAAF